MIFFDAEGFVKNLGVFDVVSNSISLCQSCITSVIEYSALEESIKFSDGFVKTSMRKQKRIDISTYMIYMCIVQPTRKSNTFGGIILYFFQMKSRLRKKMDISSLHLTSHSTILTDVLKVKHFLLKLYNFFLE